MVTATATGPVSAAFENEPEKEVNSHVKSQGLTDVITVMIRTMFQGLVTLQS